MSDAQVDGRPSTLAYVTCLIPSSIQATSPCEAAPQSSTPAVTATTPPLRPSSDSMTHCIVGESGNLSCSSSQRLAPANCTLDGPQDSQRSTRAVEKSKITFEDLASQYRQNQHKQASRKRLEGRLHATKVAVGVSARLIRVGAAAQRALVDRLRHDDKGNFITIYQTLVDLQESCDATFQRHFQRQDPLDGWPHTWSSVVDRPSDFFLQLSPQSRTDLLDILHLVRTDPQFVFEKLRVLTPTQRAALVSSTGAPWESGSDLSSSAASRSRSHGMKRSSAASLPHKDRTLAFERKDALSILLFNVFATFLDTDAAEARLRLDVWSSVCAKLLTQDGNRHDALIPYILTAWATGSEWKAKSKFELYLMDMLQAGAFLLEHVEPPPGLDVDVEPPDPLRTDVAEEFFASAVDALFKLLDDPDGGFPQAVMQLSCAILQKLEHRDDRNRFLELLFVQWFFAKFLYGALTFPEAHGLLLDFHVRNDAREKLLGQVGLRAYSQVYAILRSMHHYLMVRLTVRRRVESMLSRFQPEFLGKDSDPAQSTRKYSSGQQSPAGSIMLSGADILTLLNTLYPRSSASMGGSPMSSSGVPASPSVPSIFSERPMTAVAEPGFFKPVIEPFSRHATQGQGLLASATNFLSNAEESINRNADRIRFELLEMCGPDGRAILEPPAAEEWAVFSISKQGKLTWGLFADDCQTSLLDSTFAEDAPSAAPESAGNLEALQTAIVKLIQESPADDGADVDLRHFKSLSMADSASLKQRFNKAMQRCHHESDFIGAHYWWNAGRQLLRSVASSSTRLADDSWILEPMHTSCARSLQMSRAVIERCETEFAALHRQTRRLQKLVKDMMATVAGLRNKMWYMTDVKNSMRYEDAKNVALALKTMIYSARPLKQTPYEGRSRGNARSFGSSFLQKPELQVMNIMKAPSSQGGPNKLSDEQVDLIRKWLSHNNIDNFCKGEERIHRFCYEVQASINRLVGESMVETPVLWASELYHKERAMYEGSSHRNFLGLSSIRPFNAPSEESTNPSQGYGNQFRPADSISRYSSDASSLNHKASNQSLLSDKWRGPRDPSLADTSSIGGSPRRAASTATGDSYSTFWSTPHQSAQYAPSSSSIFSRPPSMFSDNSAQPPRRDDRKTHGKAAFIDDLKQTLTSLLLSDLGSPVWSCGSETDAWFTNALNQQRIQVQMKKRARIQRFYTECDERLVRDVLHRAPSNRTRSQSLGSSDRPLLGDTETPLSSPCKNKTELGKDVPQFSYSAIFHRLIEVFSRHGNPFVKLKALRDLRALVVASLNTTNEELGSFTPSQDLKCQRGRSAGMQGKRSARHSFSVSQAKRVHDKAALHTPTSAVAESVLFDCRPSDYSAPSEHQIVDALRSLLLEVKPKTLFRDLQFISAFVPSETLNQTDCGTAFLQFGLAALSLKDEVCNSMVEIADNIVSQELSRRHPAGNEPHPRAGHAIEDAAGMWIITAKEGNPIAQRELAILYLTHPELLPRVTLPLTLLRDTFKAEMMYRRDKDSKSDPQSMCLALHWMQLSATGGDELARNRLREREEFESIA